MKGVALVVFDMAGTTVEDSGQVPEAFTTVLRKHGIEISDESLRALRGASKRDAIRHLVEQQSTRKTDVNARADAIYSDFREELSRLFMYGGIKPIAGATETFKWLRTRGIKIALTTGFDRMITDLIIHSIGWWHDKTIDAVVCGDDVPMGRPAPYLIFRAMECTRTLCVQCVVTVGDTVLDLQAGKNAGVRYVVGVLSGAHEKERLEKELHTHLIPSVAVIPSLQFD